MKSYKKVLTVLLIAVFGMGAAQAQLRFGVKAGLNLNSLHLSNLNQNFEDDNKCGYTLGVMTEFQVPIVGLCFDLSAMYTRMNSEITTNDGEDAAYNKNFLEIPVNLKYKFGLPVVSSVFTPYIFTGPTFAFKLDKNSSDEKFKTKGTQVAWNIGVGFELIRHLQISGSYGFGINNIAQNWVDVDNAKVKNNYWTVTAAWLF